MGDTDGFKLIIEDDEGRRSVVPVDLGEVSIGRLDGNTIRLNERNVSRRHARLFKDSSTVMAEDLDSYNGVFINGDRIKGRQELHDGDLIRIGDFQLELRGEGLRGRTEETTQRTQLRDIETTQPEIRLAEAPVSDEEDEARDEPTAIIRVSHMEDVEASRHRSTIAGQRAKLVCVSTQLAGSEYEINKTEVVVGRTADNDIAVDHRSVSRHHAKIVTAGESVKVVDLKSANGTLVNGEEYAQVDLKAGDLVELGHVKFRFVPPGENYTFTADEQAAIQGAGEPAGSVEADVRAQPTVAQPTVRSILKANRFLLLAIVGLAAAIVLMVLWLVQSARGDAVLSPPSPIEGISAPGAPASEAERQYAQAAVALQQREWLKAATLGRAALTYEPNHVKAQELVQKAESEARAQSYYDLGVTAINDNQWSQAWSHLAGISPASSYATQARALMDQVRAALITQKVQEADTALQAEDWTAAEELAGEIAKLDSAQPDISRVRAAVEEGRKRKAEKPQRKTRVKTAPKPAKAVAPPPPPAPAAKPAGTDARSLYNDGTKALKKGQFQTAIDNFGACVKADRNFCLCYRAMGITYARAGNGPKAYRYYKQYLKVCPTAKDAAEVKGILKQYENAK